MGVVLIIYALFLILYHLFFFSILKRTFKKRIIIKFMVKNKLKTPLWDFYNKAAIKSNKLLKSKITLFNLVTSQLEFDFGRQKSFY